MHVPRDDRRVCERIHDAGWHARVEPAITVVHPAGKAGVDRNSHGGPQSKPPGSWTTANRRTRKPGAPRKALALNVLLGRSDPRVRVTSRRLCLPNADRQPAAGLAG